MIGQTISHYKITEKIGEGGMGEVYRAEDTTLKREVAIKVLPGKFTQDTERLARFQREAQVLASLNHPNIAAIHSFEHSDGVHFLSMELVEGKTLAERVAKGPLPVEEALEVSRQIAEGLEAAHESGIIHRDLKPANVKITPEGKVKVLDFGLAKALEGETAAADISHSPTRTDEMTSAGVILGTAGYMSPEQARGQAVDRRTDIWSFGCVLYEALTSRQVFGGQTMTDILGAIVHKEPDWEALPESTPRGIRRLLRRCLEKDPHDRLHHMADARIEIRHALNQPVEDSQARVSTATPVWWRRTIPWAVAAVFAVFAVVAYWKPPSEPPTPQRFSINLPSPYVTDPRIHRMRISPDGKHLVYLGKRPGHRQEIFHRPLGQLGGTRIDGTEGAESLFFSPDGKWVGFMADRTTLKKVTLSGGSPVTICAVDFMCGASWGADGNILFTTRGKPGLHRVSEVGGTPEKIHDVAEGENALCWPEILPGGDAVLLTIYPEGRPQEFGVLSLKSGKRKTLGKGMYPRYTPTGHLLYRDIDLTQRAVPFDSKRLELSGNPVPILPEVGLWIDFTYSRQGTLFYLPSSQTFGLFWVNRQGEGERVTEVKIGAHSPLPRFSPDGKHLAIRLGDLGERRLWIYEIDRAALSPLTFEGSDRSPIWTPDGKHLTFASNRTGKWNIYQKPVDGRGEAERLIKSENNQYPSSWSPDGKVLLFTERSDIWVLPLGGEPQPFLKTEFNEGRPMFSPDGQRIAFTSNRSGRSEVYVTSYPEPGSIILISNGGGRSPVWAPSGRELFYRNRNNIMVVPFQTESKFEPQTPRLLFEWPEFAAAGRSYDISPDGMRFVMLRAHTEELTELNVVLNWFEELKRLVPTGE